MPAVAEPPAVAPAPAATPSQSGAILPSSSGVIHVTPSSVESSSAPKPGSARDGMFKELRKRAKTVEDRSSATSTPAPQERIQSAVSEEQGDEGAVAGASDDNATPPGAEAAAVTPATPAEKKKLSPWKLVDEWKKRAVEAETKVAEVTKGQPSEEQRKSMADEMQRKEARLKELEDEIKYVNFSKSEEFKVKYQEPYDKAWNRAMSELSEITIGDAQTGEQRTVQPADLLELVNMPLGKAREAAEQLFGSFANDVMVHRKEIRQLYESQAAALEEARKNGSTREAQMSERMKQMQSEVTKVVSETWTQANEAAAKDEKYGKFFTPLEGDTDGNQRLEKGFALVDKAFGENPFAPNLKPEDRAAIVKRHAAIRNRAAAFGRLVLQLSQKEAKISELTKELEQFKSSTPPSGGGPPSGQTAEPVGAKASVFQALRKIAK